jgi:hypothetical protein
MKRKIAKAKVGEEKKFPLFSVIGEIFPLSM